MTLLGVHHPRSPPTTVKIRVGQRIRVRPDRLNLLSFIRSQTFPHKFENLRVLVSDVEFLERVVLEVDKGLRSVGSLRQGELAQVAQETTRNRFSVTEETVAKQGGSGVALVVLPVTVDDGAVSADSEELGLDGLDDTQGVDVKKDLVALALALLAFLRNKLPHVDSVNLDISSFAFTFAFTFAFAFALALLGKHFKITSFLALLGKLLDGGEPINSMDVPTLPGTLHLLLKVFGGMDESGDTNTSLKHGGLGTLEGSVGRLELSTSVVRQEDDDRIVVHIRVLELVNDFADGSVHALSHGAQELAVGEGETSIKALGVSTIGVEENGGMNSLEGKHHEHGGVIRVLVNKDLGLLGDVLGRESASAVSSTSGLTVLARAITLPVQPSEGGGEITRNTASLKDRVFKFQIDVRVKAVELIELTEDLLAVPGGGVDNALSDLNVQLRAEADIGRINSLDLAGTSGAVDVGVGHSLLVGNMVNVVVSTIEGIETTLGGEVLRRVHSKMPLANQMGGVSFVFQDLGKNSLGQGETHGASRSRDNVLQTVTHGVPSSQERSAGGGAPRSNVLVLKDNTVVGEAFKDRGRHPRVSLPAHIVVTQIVSKNQNNMGSIVLLLLGERGHTKTQKNSSKKSSVVHTQEK